MKTLAISAALSLLVVACVSVPTDESPTTVATVPEQSVPRAAQGPLSAVTTSGDASGNRYHLGAGSLPDQPVVLSGVGPVQWVVAAETPDGIVVVSVTEDGSLDGHLLVDGVAEAYGLNLSALPAGTPPSLAVNEGVLVMGPPPGTGSTLTNPLALPSGGLAFVTEDGAVVVTESAGNRRFPVEPLPDARLVLSAHGELGVLSQPTDRYPHGIAGDPWEAGAVDIIDLATLEVSASVSIPEGRVAENVAPLWADLDDDGLEEMVVTLSDAMVGSRLAIISASGEFMAESEPIGQGNRWRHQIGVGPTGPSAETELVDVRTPHIGGVVEFFRLESDRLVLTASLSGYSSHTIGSRDMDQALLADGNGDGVVEVVVPDQAMTSLAGVQRTADGAEEVWVVALGGTLSSNLAGVTTSSGRFVLVVGLADGRVLVWP